MTFPPLPVVRPRWVLERHWSTANRPLTRVGIVGKRQRGLAPLDYTARLAAVIADIAVRCPTLYHVDPTGLLVTATRSRGRARHGLLARVTPMRLRDGSLYRRTRGTLYQVQRYFVDGREMMYLVTFCLPRFLDQSFEEKMVTIFHELFHIGPRFDGDIRRHAGRYEVHTHSKKEYDRQMADLAKEYLAAHPTPEMFDFLRGRAADLHRDHACVTATVVPRPKLIPVG